MHSLQSVLPGLEYRLQAGSFLPKPFRCGSRVWSTAFRRVVSCPNLSMPKSVFILLVRVFGCKLIHHYLQLFLREPMASQHYAGALVDVCHIVKGIGVKQQQVSPHANGDRAEPVGAAQYSRCVRCTGSQDLIGTQAGADHVSQLPVNRKARQDEWLVL